MGRMWSFIVELIVRLHQTYCGYTSRTIEWADHDYFANIHFVSNKIDNVISLAFYRLFTGRWCFAKFNNSRLVWNSRQIHMQSKCGWFSWDISNCFGVPQGSAHNNISTSTIRHHWCKYASWMHRIFGAQGKCLQPNDLTILHRRFFLLFNNIVNLWLIFIVLFFSMENENEIKKT